jgi:hypothetical protein
MEGIKEKANLRLGGERISKVLLDSSYALPDGGLEIPGGGVLFDPNERVWLGEFSAVASWETLDSANNLFYVQEQTIGAPNNRVIALSPGAYTLDSLATAMQDALNGAGKGAGVGTYAVTRTGGTMVRRLVPTSCRVRCRFSESLAKRRSGQSGSRERLML